MYIPGTFMCLSFHIKKHLKIGKGGMILTDDEEAIKWLKARRYEGRTDGVRYHEDQIDEEGWNMYMTPEQACVGLSLNKNMQASFSRALSEGLYYNDPDDYFETAISKNITEIVNAIQGG